MKTPPVASNFQENVQQRESHVKPTMTYNTSKQYSAEESKSKGSFHICFD